MGSPSLRTFRNRIDRAEMEAASLSREEVQIRRLFQVNEAGRHWGAEKPSARAGKHQCLPHLLGSLSLSGCTEILAGAGSAQNDGEFRDPRDQGRGVGWGKWGIARLGGIDEYVFAVPCICTEACASAS